MIFSRLELEIIILEITPNNEHVGIIYAITGGLSVNRGRNKENVTDVYLLDQTPHFEIS